MSYILLWYKACSFCFRDFQNHHTLDLWCDLILFSTEWKDVLCVACVYGCCHDCSCTTWYQSYLSFGLYLPFSFVFVQPPQTAYCYLSHNFCTSDDNTYYGSYNYKRFWSVSYENKLTSRNIWMCSLVFIYLYWCVFVSFITCWHHQCCVEPFGMLMSSLIMCTLIIHTHF